MNTTVISNGNGTTKNGTSTEEVKLPEISDEDMKTATTALAAIVSVFASDSFADVEVDPSKPRKLPKSWREMGNGERRLLLNRALALVNAKEEYSVNAWIGPVKGAVRKLGAIARLSAVQGYRATSEMVAKLDENTRKALVSRMVGGEKSLAAPTEAYIPWPSCAALFPAEMVEEQKIKALHDMGYKFAKGRATEANGGKRVIVALGEDFVKETLARDSDDVNEEIATLSAPPSDEETGADDLYVNETGSQG